MLRFSIWQILLLVTIVCVCLGLWRIFLTGGAGEIFVVAITWELCFALLGALVGRIIRRPAEGAVVGLFVGPYAAVIIMFVCVLRGVY